MRFQTPLIPARLIRRYKRFLADVILEETGQIVTAHCPNPGAMLGFNAEGMRVWLEPNDDPKKKLKFGWRLAEFKDGHYACIDTSLPNRIVKEALISGQVSEVSTYRGIRPELPYGANSRIDFMLSQDGFPDAYVEVKSVTLHRNDNWAEFPDCVTTRGAKHLHELSEVAQDSKRAIMLYLVGRSDCNRMKIASDIDSKYAQSFDFARACGVEILCYGTRITPEGIWLTDPLLVDNKKQWQGTDRLA